eukprot:TRINITY_DN11114_c0_g2_i2.p1 TRINITY_DN11114_c0_g2~~TRINITY_DN11114_c0_g2_i2.p1  ORF type:complete len:117 (+),score=36.36 TRINITY_DN11114_c0_g2_i2:122-472(+)
MSKGLNIAVGDQEKPIPSFEEEDEMYAGEKIKLNFELPDGQVVNGNFRGGQDVEWAKNAVAQCLGCNLSDFTLEFDGKFMPEVLSLSDFPGLKNDSTLKVVPKKGVNLFEEKKGNE